MRARSCRCGLSADRLVVVVRFIHDAETFPSYWRGAGWVACPAVSVGEGEHERLGCGYLDTDCRRRAALRGRAVDDHESCCEAGNGGSHAKVWLPPGNPSRPHTERSRTGLAYGSMRFACTIPAGCRSTTSALTGTSSARCNGAETESWIHQPPISSWFSLSCLPAASVAGIAGW